MGTFTLSSFIWNSSQSTLPALDMTIFLFTASCMTGQKSTSNISHHYLPENPSGLEARAHGHCWKQAPDIRGMCTISPLTPLLISIKTGQRKHPDSSLLHLVQLNSVNQNRSGVEISVKLNLPMPLDVVSNFSVNVAYNKISGWWTLYIHVGGERTSPLHCLMPSAHWLDVWPPKTFLRRRKQLW